jgi:hypothetical protein
METTPKKNLKYYLLEECFSMVEHLSAEGKTIPALASSILKFEKENCCDVDLKEQDVLKLHNELSKKIAPARPKTIWLLCKESQKKSILNFLGPVSLVKRLMLVAIISLIIFILISLSDKINGEAIRNTIFEESGFNLFIILSFYITSASLGAAFSNLFQANKHILKNTFDPKYETSYWIRFVLGVIAGFLLAVIIPMPERFMEDNHTTNMEVFMRPLLAMLGGFSAALVYRILFRMVYAVESIFIGKQSDVVEQKITNIKAANEMDKENERQKLINQLLSLQGQINKGKTPDEINSEIQKTISGIGS